MALIGQGRTAKPKTHYGNDNSKYKFNPIESGKGRNEKYFTLVNKDTGEIELYNNEWGRDRQVGTINSDGEITMDPGARKYEVAAFTNPESGALDSVIKNSKNMVQKESYNDMINVTDGVTQKDALASSKQLSEELINTGSTDIDINDGATIRGMDEKRRGNVLEAVGRKFFPNLKYPEKMKDTQDAIKFEILEFEARKWDSDQPGVLKERDRSNAALKKVPRGSVILPMPGGLKDNNQQDWGNAQMNPLEAVGAQLALAAFDGTDEFAGVMTGLASDIGAEGVDAAAQKLIAGEAVGKGGQLIKRDGALINPNVELLFNSPMLRTFQFQFNLSPRNQKEGQTVKQIIRTFKQASAPRKTAKGYFLRTPLIWQISYLNNAYNLNRFKECAMTSFQTDYTPNGNYSRLRDGTMSQYKITMAFSELDPIFNDDYDKLDNESAGGVGFGGPLSIGKIEDASGIGY